MYFCIDGRLASVKIRDKDSDVLVGEELSSCGHTFIEAPPFVYHDDRMHAGFRLMVLSDVAVDGIGCGDAVVFLSRSGDGLGEAGEIEAHSEGGSVKKCKHRNLF
jgi:hypothetical protein